MKATRHFSILPVKVADRIAIDGDCWIWTGAKHPAGHGIMRIAGTYEYVHRFVYEHVYGAVLDGLIIHHQCHNPPCVRPEHLRAITRKQHAAEHGLHGVAALHAKREICPKGHPLDGHDGRQRFCRTCARDRSREWARRKAQLRALNQAGG